MAANLGILMLLASCDEPESPNPFDDWGPYKSCEQTLVYTHYDVQDPESEPGFGGYEVDRYTKQGALLERNQYLADYSPYTTMLCSFEESTHAPLGCDLWDARPKKPELYVSETYGYRADGLLAWYSILYSNGVLGLVTRTRDDSDRIVRVDADYGDDDSRPKRPLDGVPDQSDVWIYDGRDELPSEIDSYRYSVVDGAYIEGVVRYVVENDQIVHSEYVTPEGAVYELHDYTYDVDGNLLKDVRDDGAEISTYAYDDRGFWVTATHEIAWKQDVRTDLTIAVTYYDCEGA